MCVKYCYERVCVQDLCIQTDSLHVHVYTLIDNKREFIAQSCLKPQKCMFKS